MTIKTYKGLLTSLLFSLLFVATSTWSMERGFKFPPPDTTPIVTERGTYYRDAAGGLYWKSRLGTIAYVDAQGQNYVYDPHTDSWILQKAPEEVQEAQREEESLEGQLKAALFREDLGQVKQLLNKNASPDIEIQGKPALLYVAQLSQREPQSRLYHNLFSLFADRINRISDRSLGITLTRLAVDPAALDTLRSLVRYISKVNIKLIDARDDEGATALMRAAGAGSSFIIQFLLTNKADINAADNQGRTPLDYAEQAHQVYVAQYLRNNGAHRGGPVATTPSLGLQQQPGVVYFPTPPSHWLTSSWSGHGT
jgi:hypothetical protein